MKVVQAAIAISILTKIHHRKSGFSVASHLFFERMGNLNAGVIFQTLLEEAGIAQRIKRKSGFEASLGLIKHIVQAIVQPGQK
jgi:Na+/melibiose symporter-like transporter